MVSTTKREFLKPLKALLIGLLVLGTIQESFCENYEEVLIKKIPSKLEHSESGSNHYKLTTLKMNGVQHRLKSDDSSGPPQEMTNLWPPRPGRRSLVQNQWWIKEPGSPRPGRRTLDDQVRLQRPRPGRTLLPQKPETVNPFGVSTRPGRNAEEDLPWEYTGSSLHKGENKESHTLSKIAPEKKRDLRAEQLKIQRDFPL